MVSEPSEPMQFGEPAPVPNNLPSMHDLVIQDMQARKDFGYAKYKTLLQPFNGRDPLKDLYEEALDLVVYFRQALYERDNPAAKPHSGEAVERPPAKVDRDVPAEGPRRCYCGGPEEVLYGHVFGKGTHCRGKVEGGK